MAKHDYCILWLTCPNAQEADNITNTLLVKHLVACVKQSPVQAKFHWKGKIGSANEVSLMMESRLDLFEKIETEVAKRHSYETFVLEATPAVKVSKDAQAWLEKELSDG